MKFLLKQIKQKPIEYLVLAIIFVISIILFVSFHSQNIIYVTGVLYFLWSLYHHYRRGDLQLSIIIEYLLIIFFGIIVLTFGLF